MFGTLELVGCRYEPRIGLDRFPSERQLEFTRDLRPEFTQHIVTDIECEAVADSPRRVTGAVLVAGMIEVAQCGGARGTDRRRPHLP